VAGQQAWTRRHQEQALIDMNQKQAIAIEIALQTHVLRTCPVHREVWCDDDVDPAGAFALAVELVRQHVPCAHEFRGDAHELTDLLSETIGAAPNCCPHCPSSMATLGASAAAVTSWRTPPLR
jgi:hypothetical protein